MDQLASLHWIEIIGWLASILTVASYSVSTMMPLRLLAISSSVCFIAYSFTLQLWPLLAMELILLPINTYRFWQVLSLRGKLTRAAAADQTDFSVVKAYGKPMRFAEGAKVFSQGDAVDNLYFLAKGRIEIEELGIEMGAGDIFGEIAFFTDAATRTASARCLEPSEIYALSEKQFMRLQFEDPRFGMSIMRTITRRLLRQSNQTPVGAQ